MLRQRTELNFNGQNVYVGIDVHLKSWTVSILTDHLAHKTFTQPPMAEVLVSYLSKNFPGGSYHSVYEAGFSGFWTHYKLQSMGVISMVVNAADVPSSQKEQLRKDDPVDSRKLARELRSGNLEPIYIPSQNTLEERSLVRTRAMLVKDMTRFKQRLKSHLYFYGITYPAQFEKSGSHWSRRFMRWLKQDVSQRSGIGQQALCILIQEVEQQRELLLEVTRSLRKLALKDKYASNMDLLRTIPGIGFTIAITLLSELEDINRFENTDHLAGYIGLVPNRHDSGDKKNVLEMTFRGQSLLKRYLIESSWFAARLDPALNMCFNSYCKRMEPNKAIVKIARKLVNRIYFVLKNKKEYVSCVVK